MVVSSLDQKYQNAVILPIEIKRPPRAISPAIAKGLINFQECFIGSAHVVSRIVKMDSQQICAIGQMDAQTDMIDNG